MKRSSKLRSETVKRELFEECREGIGALAQVPTGKRDSHQAYG
jgi:hypothetical protein